MKFSKIIPASMMALAMCLAIPACGSDDKDDDKDPCEGISEAGICENNVAIGCVDGQRKELNCTAMGMNCAVLPDEGASCTSGIPCGDIDGNGICDNGVAKFCGQDGLLNINDCTEQGMICQSGDGLAHCDYEDSICGPYAKQDGCSGGSAMRCITDEFGVSAELEEEDCEAKGMMCTVVEDIGAVCYTEGDCGDVTEEGICDGDVSKACMVKDGKALWLVDDCAAMDMHCIIDEAMGSVCTDAEPDPGCGEVDSQGYCQDDHTLIYCNAYGVVETQNCGADETCQLVNDRVGYACVPNGTEDEECSEDKCASDGKTLIVCDFFLNETFNMTCPEACGDDGYGYDACIFPSIAGKPCGDVTETGKCAEDGSYVVYCVDGVLEPEACMDGCDDAGGYYASCNY